MEIKLERKELVDVLSVGMMQAGKSKTLLILDNVRVDVKGLRFKVTSFSVQCSVSRYGVLTGSAGDISFLINPQDLLKAVKTLRDNELVLDITGNTLAITHKKGRIELSTMAIDEFPTMESVSGGVDFSLPAGLLGGWVSTSRDFVADDDLRPQMCGMYLYSDTERGEIGVCATDTRVLYTDSIDYSGGSDAKAIIPTSAFATILAILSGVDSDTMVDVSIDAKNIKISTDKANMTCQLQVGNYPNFRAVIPAGYGIGITANKADLLDSVSRVALMADKSTSLVKLTVVGDKIDFVGSDLNYGRSATDTCECEKTGDDITIGANADKFISCVNHVESVDIQMSMSAPNRPIVFKDANNERKTILAMPMITD